jgi:hypothetical protein
MYIGYQQIAGPTHVENGGGTAFRGNPPDNKERQDELGSNPSVLAEVTPGEPGLVGWRGMQELPRIQQAILVQVGSLRNENIMNQLPQGYREEN